MKHILKTKAVSLGVLSVLSLAVVLWTLQPLIVSISFPIKGNK